MEQRNLLAAGLIALAAAWSAPAFAADAASAPAKPKTAQQQRMADCNAQAKTQALKGADRKTFMSQCLKGQSASAPAAAPTPAAAPAPAVEASTPKTSQKDKMTACNAQAKTQALKGDARKSFMSQCLSK